MSKPAFETFATAASPVVSPSRALVSAALAGLLCAATPACESAKVGDGTESVTGGTGGSAGASTSGSGGASGTGGNATSGGATSTGGASSTGGGAGTVGSGGSPQNAGGTRGDAAVVSTGGADGGAIIPPPDDAGVDCRPDGGLYVITFSAVVSGLTLEKFTTDCDARHGTVEIPPHCGGFNSCMGMSYDSGTQVLTEHTCKGMNTCVGFNCVVCP